MAKANKSLPLLPAFLIPAGLFFLAVGLQSNGPDQVGGIVFGGVLLAAAVAIHHRRAREALSKRETAEPAARRIEASRDETH
jgi:hypothetical protein